MKTFTVKELISALQIIAETNPHAHVHCDEDDYPHVVGITLSSEYDGPEEYKPAEDTVLLKTDFPKDEL